MHAVQGEDPDYAWAVTVMLCYLKLLLGLVSVVLSVCWLVQVVLCMSPIFIDKLLWLCAGRGS